MNRTWEKLTNYVEQAVAKPADSSEDRLRKRTFTLITFLKCLCCVPWALMYAALGLSVAALLPLSYGTVILIGIAVFLATRNFAVFVNVAAFFMLLVPVLLQWTLGGFAASGAVMLWSLLAPLAILVFRGVGEAKVWFAAFVLVAIMSCLSEQYMSPQEDRSTWVIGLFFVMNIGAVSAIVFGTVLYFVGQVQKEQDTVKEQNQALESTLTQLQEMQHQLILKEKMATLGTLAAGIAHEINNPIGAVRAAADVCGRCLGKVAEMVSLRSTAQEIQDDPQYQRSLEMMRDNSEVIATATERIATIVNNLKDFARLDEAEFKEADIHSGIDSTLSLIQHEIGEDIKIIKEYGQIPAIKSYPNRLNQVFMSVLSRSVDDIDGMGAVTIQTFVDNGHVCVKICDDGRGMPAEEVEHLFELRFDTTNSRVSLDTSLPSAFNVVRSLDGDLTVASEVGKGTEFTIILPKQ